MKMRSVLCTLAAAGALGSAAVGAASPVPDARAEAQRLIDRPINAALLYQRLWRVHDSRIEAFNEATPQGELDFENPQWVPDASLSEVLQDLQPLIKGLMAAAEEPEADWGIEHRAGVEATVPHLGALRESVRLLRADARRLAAEGAHEAAADRIIALYRMSTQSRRDGLLICAVVNMAIGSTASSETRVLVDVYEIDPDIKARIVRAIDTLPDEDPYGIEYAIIMEPHHYAEWIRHTFTEERPGERLVEAMMIGNQTMADRLRAMTRDDLAQELERYEQFGRDAIRAWNDPEALAKVTELDYGILPGKYGHIAAMSPSIRYLRQQFEQADRDLRRTRAALLRAED